MDLKKILMDSLTSGPPYWLFPEKSEDRTIKINRVEYKFSTLTTYLSRLVSEGAVFDAGKGWYSTLSSPFVLDTKPVRKIAGILKNAFPLLDFSCWSTEQINAYSQHLSGGYVTFVYLDSDAMPSAADHLRGKGYSVFVDPGKAEVKKQFWIDGNTVVLRKTITKQPEDENHAAPIEKILVDLVWEADKLPIIDPAETRIICNHATGAGRIHISPLLSYAKRRMVDFSWLKTIKQLQKNEKSGDV